MIKTTLFISVSIFGAVAASAQVPAPPATAEQTLIPLPQADKVMAQFSYLELSHNANGFSLSVTDKTAVFVDLEFPGDFHIRIGF